MNSKARESRHDSDKTQTNKLECWMILKISLRAKAGVPETLMRRKLRLHSLYFPQNSLTLTESSGEFSDLHSIFRLHVLSYLRQALKSVPGVHLFEEQCKDSKRKSKEHTSILFLTHCFCTSQLTKFLDLQASAKRQGAMVIHRPLSTYKFSILLS